MLAVVVVHKILLYIVAPRVGWQKCNDETLLPSSFSSFNFSLDDKKKEAPVISISLCLLCPLAADKNANAQSIT